MQIYTFIERKFRPDTTSSSQHILTLEVMKVAGRVPCCWLLNTTLKQKNYHWSLKVIEAFG